MRRGFINPSGEPAVGAALGQTDREHACGVPGSKGEGEGGGGGEGEGEGEMMSIVNVRLCTYQVPRIEYQRYK